MKEDLSTEIFFNLKIKKIISSLLDDTYFNKIKTEEQEYINNLNILEAGLKTKLLYEQRTIEQLYSIEEKNTKGLINDIDQLKKSSNAHNLSLDLIHKMEKALFSLEKKIIDEKKLKLSESLGNNKNEIFAKIEEQKNKVDILKETRLSEINKLIQARTKQLLTIHNFIETAPFETELWENIKFKNPIPELKKLLIYEELKTYRLFDNEISFKIPLLSDFFTKNSLTLVHNKDTRKNIKPAIDQLILRLLMTAEPGNIQFYFMDAFGDSSLFVDYLDLPSELYNKKIFTSAVDIEKAILELQKLEDNITQQQLKSYGNVTDFNQKNPKSIIPYRVIIFDSFPQGITINLFPSIEKLARIASKAGIHFIFIVDEKNMDNASSVINKTTKITIPKDISFPEDNIIKSIKKTVLNLVDQHFNSDKAILFEEYNKDLIWDIDSSEKLTIPLGMNGANVVNFEFDQVSKSHAVVTGQTGCGKSFLLHTLITSACMQYSPDELRLFLVDLKSGVEFQRYATHQLPHADFIALHGSPEFGIHILKQVTNKIKERGEYLKKHGAKDLSDFKRLYPEKIMPRYLIIVDEYQEMFRDRSMRSEALDKIDIIAKQGRSFGFNLLLASQTIELPDDILSNFGLRIVMRTNAQIARRALDSYNSETGKLKAGQAFISDGYDIEKVQSFFLRKDPEHNDILEKIKNSWTEKGTTNYTDKLIIFNRDSSANLINNKTIIKNKPNINSRTIVFSPGEKLMIDGKDYNCSLSRDNSNNILVIGGKLDYSLRAMYGTFMSMLPQLDPKETEINFLNYLNQSNEKLFDTIKSSYDFIDSKFDKTGYFDQSSSINELLVKTIEQIDTRVKQLNSDSYFSPHLLCIYNIENNSELQEVQKTSPLNKTIVSKSEQTNKLVYILEHGPAVGIHCIIHTSSPNTYYQVFNEDDGDLNLFQHRVLLQMSQDDSKDFLGSYRKDAGNLVDNDAGESGHNRAIYYDNFSQNFFDIIKPYDFLSETQITGLIK